MGSVGDPSECWGIHAPHDAPDLHTSTKTTYVTGTNGTASSGSGGRERSHSFGSGEKMLGLEWHDLCCRTRGPERGGQGREILKRVSGRARPGRLLAILGPSGSGGWYIWSGVEACSV